MDGMRTIQAPTGAVVPSGTKRNGISGRAVAGMLILVFACGSAWAKSVSAESGYHAEIKTAMDRMMAGMDVPPTGDVDADFVAMMEPHHQGAIDMAIAELRYGSNERLRRIAQEIIVDQQQEIAAMRLAIDRPLPPSTPVPTQPSAPAPTKSNGPMPHPMHMEH